MPQVSTTQTSPIYELYGLRVRSDIALAAPVCQMPVADIDLQWGDSEALSISAPAGTVVATVSFGDGRGYTLTETDTGYAIRFESICEFRITADRRRVRVHLFQGADRRAVPILFCGNVVTFLLALAGECVLHASSVEYRGRALAFVGGCGMGKSTLAALLCSGGATLIGDDVLRLRPDGDSLRCFPGTRDIRLRPAAAALADRFAGAACGPTADGRIAVAPANTCDAFPPLHAIVIPQPAHDQRQLDIERLTPLEALVELVRYPRVLGWQVIEPISRQFLWLGQLVQKVAVFRARIPWGPPFDAELPAALLRGVGLEDAR